MYIPDGPMEKLQLFDQYFGDITPSNGFAYTWHLQWSIHVPTKRLNEYCIVKHRFLLHLEMFYR